jgi:hypothetical protein
MIQRGTNEDGFTVIEAAVALALSILVFTALTTSVTAALNGSNENRYQQLATGIVMSHLEIARSLEWDEVAMSHVDPGSPVLDSTGGSLRGVAVDLAVDEMLVVDGAEGLVFPRTEEVADGVGYTVWSHVTAVGDLRRVVVVVTWNVGATTRVLQGSTLVSEVSSR